MLNATSDSKCMQGSGLSTAPTPQIKVDTLIYWQINTWLSTNRGTLVGMLTRLWAGQQKNCDWILGRSTRFLPSPKGSDRLRSSPYPPCNELFPRDKATGGETNHLPHHCLPFFVFVNGCTRKNLPLFTFTYLYLHLLTFTYLYVPLRTFTFTLDKSIQDACNYLGLKSTVI
jgi:hypothetical protein